MREHVVQFAQIIIALLARLALHSSQIAITQIVRNSFLFDSLELALLILLNQIHKIGLQFDLLLYSFLFQLIESLLLGQPQSIGDLVAVVQFLVFGLFVC